MSSRKHVVIAGVNNAPGAALADRYREAGAMVTGLDIEGQELEMLASWVPDDPIDVLVFTDGFSAPARRATMLRRSEFEAVFARLTFAPFRLANLLRPRLAANGGSKLVLLTRRSASMTHLDEAGRYLERPFRAAAHALWRCLSVEWRELGIECLVLALDDTGQVDPGLIGVIDAARVPVAGCSLLDSGGSELAW